MFHRLAAFMTPCCLPLFHRHRHGWWIPEAPHALSLHWSRKIPFGPSFPESSVSQNFLPVSSCCRDTGAKRKRDKVKKKCLRKGSIELNVKHRDTSDLSLNLLTLSLPQRYSHQYGWTNVLALCKMYVHYLLQQSETRTNTVHSILQNNLRWISCTVAKRGGLCISCVPRQHVVFETPHTGNWVFSHTLQTEGAHQSKMIHRFIFQLVRFAFTHICFHSGAKAAPLSESCDQKETRATCLHNSRL